MSGIEDLRQRVADAEHRFGLIDEARSKYSERLIGLMNAVEGRIRELQDQIEQQRAERVQQAAEAERAVGENEQLRTMLHSLLRAIEAGGRDVLAETMHALEVKVSALIDGSAAGQAAARPEPDPEPGPEPELEIADPGSEIAEVAAEDILAEELADRPVPEVDGPVAEAADRADHDELAPEAPEADAGPGLEDMAPAPPTEVAAAPEAAREPAPPGADATEAGSVSLTEIMQRVSTMMGESGPLGLPEDTAPRIKKAKAARPAPVPPADKSGTRG